MEDMRGPAGRPNPVLQADIWRKPGRIEMAEITVYGSPWCGDCRRAKQFLKDRGVAFRDVNIEESPEGEALVLKVNNGRRKIPTIEVDGRYFASSPFDPYQIAEELKIPLNS